MNMRTIVSIDDNATVKLNDYSTGEGVRIVLDDLTNIEFAISMQYNCCEQFDFLQSTEDVKYFEGAELLFIEEIDNWPRSIENPYKEYGFDAGGYQAIRLTTSVGELDFVVYNAQSGCYSHTTIFRNGDVVKENSL